jgi:D-alanine-D-alanine ligase
MGGWGEEREISLQTGDAIAAGLASRGHRPIRIVAGPGLEARLKESRIEIAFIALHGRLGEDGAVQGLLEVMGIPYTGSGVLASALGMNKAFAKKLFRLHNLPTPSSYAVGREHVAFAVRMHGDFGFPCVVKPARGGSSIGVSVVQTAGDLAAALEEACQFGGEALVERFVSGKEITVGILDDAVLGSCEIEYPAPLFNFECKYRRGSSYFLPPRLSPARIANIESLALAAYRALGCRGYARVDFIASERDNDQLLEVNTLPGLTRTSLLPKIAAHAGLPFNQLVERILLLARCDPSSPEGEVNLSAEKPKLAAG